MQGLKANTFATAMSALGQKRAFALQKPHVRFTPDSDRERGHGGRPRENARTPYGPGKGVVGTANSTPKYAELLCTTSREFCLQQHSLRHGHVRRVAPNYHGKRFMGVRFASERGHVRCNSSCLLWARSGHCWPLNCHAADLTRATKACASVCRAAA